MSNSGEGFKRGIQIERDNRKGDNRDRDEISRDATVEVCIM
jgi:hypothetical protein